MPRLSVTIYAGAFLAAMALAFPALAERMHMRESKQQRTIVRNLNQLRKDKIVNAIAPHYLALSAANVVFTQCADALNISEGGRRYLDGKFTTVARDYLQAFDDAYHKRTGAPSSQDMLNRYADYIKTEQYEAVSKTAMTIRQKGCRDSSITRIYNYVAELQKAGDPAQKAMSESQRKASAPLTFDPTTPKTQLAPLNPVSAAPSPTP